MTTALYVDNSTEMLPILLHFCEQNGAVVLHVARSGEEALVWLLKNTADVIISEYDLPGMSGIRLLEVLHSRGIMAPFIFFTSCTSLLLKNKAHDAGAAGLVVRDGTGKKPVLQLMRLLTWVVRKSD